MPIDPKTGLNMTVVPQPEPSVAEEAKPEKPKKPAKGKK